MSARMTRTATALMMLLFASMRSLLRTFSCSKSFS